MAETAPVLDVDLVRFERGDARARAAIVDGVRRSLETGFVYLAHDLPETLLDEAYGMLGAFFALPTRSKQRFAQPDSRGQRGYTGVGVETAATSTVADWKEMLNWGEPAPPGHPLGRRYPDRYGEPGLPDAAVPGLAATGMALHRALADLQRRFLRIVALGLGADEALFEPMVEHGATLTRAIRYPAMRDAAVAFPESSGEPAALRPVWAAEHADINLVTALPRATAPGLQIRTARGWIDAVPPPDHAILNTGMMLEHLSNGMLPAGRHRVVAGDDATTDRLSVVQFCHPTPTTILAPLACCIGPEQPQRFPAISAADRLDEVLWEIQLDR